ncbi:MAG TPA: hypothetical protein VMW83_06115 [Spirochaetia bacterium]|nr:hypothetical protein [Spirochaetia bacterium]
MDEILVVWELDGLCHLPAGQIEKAAQVARELGQSFHRSSAEGVLLVNSPFTGRQVALIVESEAQGTSLSLGGALQELLMAASARVNLVRLAGHRASLPLGGHLLLWLTDGAEHAPLVIVPGKYYGSTRLASLLTEELSSAVRLTPGTEVLFLESPRGPLPASMPAVLIECPPAPPGAVKHWAAGLKQGLARHFSGEGTSLSSGERTGSEGGSDTSREETVQVFWRRLKQVVPEARLTAAAKTVFNLGEDSAPAPPSAPVNPVVTTSSHQAAMKTARAAMVNLQARQPGLPPALFGRHAPASTLPRAPAAGFKYPASPYPVSMAPFTRPSSTAGQRQEAQPFYRPQLGRPAPAAGTGGGTESNRSDGQNDSCGPGSPLR